jgi:hypothetical protein
LRSRAQLAYIDQNLPMSHPVHLILSVGTDPMDARLRRMAAAQLPHSHIRCCLARSAGRIFTDFCRRNSDYDLHVAHVLPLDAVLGLEVRDETVEQSMTIPPHSGPLPHEGNFSGHQTRRWLTAFGAVNVIGRACFLRLFRLGTDTSPVTLSLGNDGVEL